MGMWDAYESRIKNSGITPREEILRREQYMLHKKLKDSLSYHEGVLVNDEVRNVAIINSDNLNEKMIYSMPGEDIVNGSMVYWMNNHWVVTERDANCEVYTKAKMLQCNYLLKWIEIIDGEPTVMEQWCIVDDGTKSGRSKRPCLAYWKRYVKTTPLIAGISLEHYMLSGMANSHRRNEKIVMIGQSAAKSRIEKRSTTRWDKCLEWGALNHMCGMVKI